MHWDDLLRGSGPGVFTTTIGSAPNRQFIIRVRRDLRLGAAAHFEAVFTEGSPNIRSSTGRPRRAAPHDRRHPGLRAGATLANTGATRPARRRSGLNFIYAAAARTTSAATTAATPPPAAATATAATTAAAATTTAAPPPPPAGRCRVPRVIGLTLGRAKARIRARHCRSAAPPGPFKATRPRHRPEPAAGRRHTPRHRSSWSSAAARTPTAQR